MQYVRNYTDLRKKLHHTLAGRQLAQAQRERGEDGVLGRQATRVGKETLEDREPRKEGRLKRTRAAFVGLQVEGGNLVSHL